MKITHSIVCAEPQLPPWIFSCCGGMLVSMPITQYDIDKLKSIYERQCGETISNDEAWAMGMELVNLFRLLLGEKPESITRDKK